MQMALASSVSTSSNILRGVYSHSDDGRVWWGRVGGGLEDFPAGSARSGRIAVCLGAVGGSMTSDAFPPFFRGAGYKVGCKKSAEACQMQGFPPFSTPVRLMGRWQGGAARSGGGRGRAPLAIARTFRHPVAPAWAGFLKIAGPRPAPEGSMRMASGPKRQSTNNGSGFWTDARQNPIKRVGDRLISAVLGTGRGASVLSVNAGLELATLCGRGARVN